MANHDRREEDPSYNRRCGRRLMVARESLEPEYNQRELATFLKVHFATYNNWERGIALVRRDVVKKLKDSFGVTYDWIYDGDPSGLAPALRAKILPHKDENPELFREQS